MSACLYASNSSTSSNLTQLYFNVLLLIAWSSVTVTLTLAFSIASSEPFSPFSVFANVTSGPVLLIKTVNSSDSSLINSVSFNSAILLNFTTVFPSSEIITLPIVNSMPSISILSVPSFQSDQVCPLSVV